jgi:hypothetical protein
MAKVVKARRGLRTGRAVLLAAHGEANFSEQRVGNKIKIVENFDNMAEGEGCLMRGILTILRYDVF